MLLLGFCFSFFNSANFPEVPLKIKDKSQIALSKVIKLQLFNEFLRNSNIKEVMIDLKLDSPKI